MSREQRNRIVAAAVFSFWAGAAACGVIYYAVTPADRKADVLDALEDMTNWRKLRSTLLDWTADQAKRP